MSRSLPIVTYPALQLLLLSCLKEVIYLQSDVFQLPVSSLPLKAGNSPLDRGGLLSRTTLHRVRDTTKIAYSSAIAHKLAKISGISAIDWADQLADQFHKTAGVLDLSENRPLIDTTSNLRDFTVKVLPPAQLYFELTNFGLASWFQFLLHTPPQRDFQLNSDFRSDEVLDTTSSSSLTQQNCHFHNLFLSQYAYARCSSLLHLAHTHHLWICPTSRLVGEAIHKAAIARSEISWLTTQGEWRLRHPSEQALIAQLITTIDTLATWTRFETADLAEPKILVELVTGLTEAFLAFYSACRFWGEIQKTSGDLVQARLGLVWVTRSLLELLLRDGLGVVTPTEL